MDSKIKFSGPYLSKKQSQIQKHYGWQQLRRVDGDRNSRHQTRTKPLFQIINHLKKPKINKLLKKQGLTGSGLKTGGSTPMVMVESVNPFLYQCHNIFKL